jgi:hypothetical protein
LSPPTSKGWLDVRDANEWEGKNIMLNTFNAMFRLLRNLCDAPAAFTESRDVERLPSPRWQAFLSWTRFAFLRQPRLGRIVDIA